MDSCGPLVHHHGAQPGEPVDYSEHRRLVARDERAGQYDGVPGVDPNLPVLAASHPGQG